MAAALFGDANLEWGLTEETGILAQSYDRTVTGEKKQAKNHEGETEGISYYDPHAEHSVEGYIAGTTGIAAAAFGTALVIANIITGNGVSAGDVICSGVTDRLQNEDYRMITATADQWPLIVTA